MRKLRSRFVILCLLILSLSACEADGVYTAKLVAGGEVLVPAGTDAYMGILLLDGRVTDFIDLGLGAWRWPAFNLADSFIVVGVICLALVKMKIAPQEGEAAEPLTGDARTPPSPASTHE